MNPLHWSTKVKVVAIGALIFASGLIAANAANNSSKTLNDNQRVNSPPTVQGTASSKLACTESTSSKDVSTVSIPFQIKYQDDNTLAQGTTKIIQVGVNGEKVTTETTTIHLDCTTTKDTTDKITKNSVDQIVANGTYIAPTPVAPSDPCDSGITAICVDGTYSYSQHRSGTCSHHHGVARWCI